MLRLVTWNIEKGKRWNLLEKCLDNEHIRSADILCLNEVDDGMARSQNRSIAYEIGESLGMNVAFGPAFQELTKGTQEERSAPGENTRSIQGNATLTRLSIISSQNVKLPVCRDYSSSEERRLGGRHVLIVRLDCGSRRVLTVANTHLEVLTTPHCRARQMDFLLKLLEKGPAVVAGDFNTNTFKRGSSWGTMQSIIRLMQPGIKEEVMQPWKYEPLFDRLRRAGFSWEEFQDNQPTCVADLSVLDDGKYLPPGLVGFILHRVRHLPMRLDWIAGRGVEPQSPGRTVLDLPCQPSDHLPITCDLVLQKS